jgi:hypothetical protein
MTGATSYYGLVGAFLPVAALAATNHTGNGSRMRRPPQKNRSNSAELRPLSCQVQAAFYVILNFQIYE